MQESPDTLPLETALDRLDAIVREMETGDLSIETLIQRFEEGVALTRTCRTKLEQAESRIKIAIKDAEGDLRLEDFATEATNE